MISTAEKLQRLRVSTKSGEARRIREAAQLSQNDLAVSIDVDPTAVSRWERGVSTPRGAAALRYAALLDRLNKAAAA